MGRLGSLSLPNKEYEQLSEREANYGKKLHAQ
jgi:hypothetical protein